MYAPFFPEFKAEGAMHLKNANGQTEEGASNYGAWLDFFIYAQQQWPSHKFIVFGNDSLEEPLLSEVRKGRLLNLVCASEVFSPPEFSLGYELSCMSLCDAYFGSASGLATVAQFSDLPHIILKNVDHHKGDMMQELGLGDRAEFSLSTQKIRRVDQTKMSLIREYEDLEKCLGA
jgi:hypothetical protein